MDKSQLATKKANKQEDTWVGACRNVPLGASFGEHCLRMEQW